MLARSHVLVALATWGALYLRPSAVPGAPEATGASGAAVDATAQDALGALASHISLTAPVIGAAALPDADLAGRLLLTAGLVALGALLPDLDHPHAWLARWRLAHGGLLGLIRPFALPSHLLHEQFGHRGAMHSLFAPALLWLVATLARDRWPATADILAPLTWGYVLHLAADLLTRRGLPLLAPLWRGRFHLPRPLAVRTGTWGEALYVALILLAAAAYAIPRPS